MMDRDHAIRLAVSGLRGKQREDMIDYLLRHPEALRKVLGARLHTWSTDRSGLRPRRRQEQVMDAWASRRS